MSFWRKSSLHAPEVIKMTAVVAVSDKKNRQREDISVSVWEADPLWTGPVCVSILYTSDSSFEYLLSIVVVELSWELTVREVDVMTGNWIGNQTIPTLFYITNIWTNLIIYRFHVFSINICISQSFLLGHIAVPYIFKSPQLIKKPQKKPN